MSLRGDTPRLRQLSAAIRNCGDAVDAATGLVEEAAAAAYGAQFAGTKDPWGSSWAGSASNSRTLFRTGALANPTFSKFPGKVTLRAESYWVHLQRGSNGMEPRALLPFIHGSDWDGPIEAAVERVVNRHLEVV